MAMLHQAHQAVEQALLQPARGTHGKSARAQPLPMEPMEPIAEERSERAMDIAQAVVEKLDIDRKLDEQIKELTQRGDRIFRDIQIRQEQSSEALCRTVAMCLESQRNFQEEHNRLLATVKDLAAMVVPHTPLQSQALEAQARSAAIAEEHAALKRQMEEHRMSTAAGTAAIAAMTATLAPPAPLQLGSGTFKITLRKADDVSLGLSVNADEELNHLIVDDVLPGGAVESWNRQCIGDGSGERVVVPGDRIVKVNDIEQDVKKMLEECTKKRLVKMLVTRNPAAAALSCPSSATCSALTPVKKAAAQASEFTPEKSTLRKMAPEFVRSGIDAPLQQTQHLSAPPGLFFPMPENCSASKVVPADISAKMDAAAGELAESDKENSDEN